MTTTVITTQPGAGGMMDGDAPPRDWSSGLCACFDDLPSCLVAFCCTPCMECWVAHTAEECALLPCIFPMSSVAIRTKIRVKHNIKGSICNDCLIYAFCTPCTSAQLKREMDNIKVGIVS